MQITWLINLLMSASFAALSGVMGLDSSHKSLAENSSVIRKLLTGAFKPEVGPALLSVCIPAQEV